MRDNLGNSGTLTGRQTKVLSLLLYNTSVTEVADKSGVSRRQIHRWMSIPAFKDELTRARQAVRDDSIEELKLLFARAVDTLAGLLGSFSERTKLRACELILNYNLNVIELAEIDERLKRLENASNNS